MEFDDLPFFYTRGGKGEATATPMAFDILRDGRDHPGLSDALLLWSRRRASAGALPTMAQLAPLFEGAIAEFVNLVDVSDPDPANFRIMRSRLAARMRGEVHGEWFSLMQIRSPLRELELLSLFYVRAHQRPDLKLLYIPNADDSARDDNFIRLLLPASTTEHASAPDRILSVFSCLNGPRPPRIGTPAEGLTWLLPD